MKQPIFWKDHVVEYPNRYVERDLGGGYIEHEKAPGEIIQQGTPMNAANLDDMDFGGIEGILLGLSNSDHIRKAEDAIGQLQDDLATEVSERATAINNLNTSLSARIEGEWKTVTLTNSLEYPFNNSQQTVGISPSKASANYFVHCEVQSYTGGGVGDIIISDKLVNGFKIRHTGGASQVVVKCLIHGGN